MVKYLVSLGSLCLFSSNDTSVSFPSPSIGFSFVVSCILAAPVFQVLSGQFRYIHITATFTTVQVFRPKTNSFDVFTSLRSLFFKIDCNERTDPCEFNMFVC